MERARKLIRLYVNVVEKGGVLFVSPFHLRPFQKHKYHSSTAMR